VAAEALLEVAHAGKCAPAPLAPSVREISSPPRAPVPSSRGAFISPSRSWIIATYGRDVYEASVATLADEHRSVFTGELISVLWYPLEPWTAILGQVRKHAWRVRGESETTFDRRHLHETIGTTLTKVYRTDLGLFDPQAIVAKVTPLLRRIYSHGDYEVVENREGRCVLRFRDAPVQMLPELQRSFPLAASWMLEIAGQEVTRQDLAPMVRAGMFSCVLTLQYRPKAPARGASEPVGVVVALPSHRNLVTRIVGRILLLCENMKTPSDEEWNECLKLLEQLKRAERLPAVLVITDGGGPNAAQREALRRALNSQPIRVAVISDSPKVRFVSAAVALMNKGQKGFKRCEMPQAHAYLGLEPQGAQAAERAIAEMVVQLDSSARA
jgi:hypothetical protein